MISQRQVEIEEEDRRSKCSDLDVSLRRPSTQATIAKETRGAPSSPRSRQSKCARKNENGMSSEELAQIERVKAQALNARKENHTVNIHATAPPLGPDHLANAGRLR